MKIVKFQGGLGNQMFQYAFYKSLEYHFPKDIIKADLTFYKEHNVHNGYELNKIFKIKVKIASISDIILTENEKVYKEESISYNPEVFDINGAVYYNGFWQSENYFLKIKNLIKQEFIFPEIENVKYLYYLDKIKNTDSVAINIRRGDYVGNSSFEVCNLEYYNKAIELIKKEIKNPTFFVVSDDEKYCKENFKGNEYIIIDKENREQAYITLDLMTKCNHHIIPNSSFGWWAIYLANNKNKGIHFVPSEWYNIGTTDYKIDDIIQPDWRKIEVYKKPLVNIIIFSKEEKNDLILFLKSIINQTYDNFEILIISGSFHLNNNIIDTFPKNDKRIKILNKNTEFTEENIKIIIKEECQGEFIINFKNFVPIKKSRVGELLGKYLENKEINEKYIEIFTPVENTIKKKIIKIWKKSYFKLLRILISFILKYIKLYSNILIIKYRKKYK